MTEYISQAPTPPAQANSSSWSKFKRPVFIVLGVILVTSGALWVNRSFGTTEKVSYQTSRYSMAAGTKKLDASGKGGAITFESPAQFTSIYKDSEQIVLYQSVNARGGSVSTGYLAALHAKASPPITSSYLKEMNRVLLNPQDSHYAAYALAFQKFVQDHTGSEYVLTFSSPAVFTNSTIRNNAWKVNFSYRVNSKTASHLPEKKQGTVVLMAGKQTWYYLMLTATESNWQINQDIWQQVMSSIKIDV